MPKAQLWFFMILGSGIYYLGSIKFGFSSDPVKDFYSWTNVIYWSGATLLLVRLSERNKQRHN